MEGRNDSLIFLFNRAIYNKNTRNKKLTSDEEQKDSIKLDIYLNNRFKFCIGWGT